MAAELTFKGLLNDQLDVKSQHNYLRYDKHLGDKKENVEIINNILGDEQDHLVCAPTGSGKTTIFIEIGLGLLGGIPRDLVIAVPLVMIANQKYDDYVKLNHHIGKIVGRTTDSNGRIIKATSNDTIKSFFCKKTKTNVILCVYDSLLRFTELAKNTCKNYILVIDECHQLTSSVNFRTTAINNMLQAKDKFKKTIFVTGTPQGTIHLNDRQNTHFFQVEPKKIIKQTIQIIYYEDHPLYELYKHIQTNDAAKKKVVVLLDNRESLLLFQRLLENTLNKKVVVLSSHDRNSEEGLYIINNSKISDDTDFLLTTRVISEGIDLDNDDIGRVYIIDVDDFLLKRQFLGRFRTKQNEIFELINKNQKESPIINYKKKVADYTKLIESYDPSGLINPSYKSREKSLYRIKKIKSENRHQDLSKYMAANFVMDEIYNENIYSNYSNMEKYYKTFTDFSLEQIVNPANDDTMTLEEFNEQLNVDLSIEPSTRQWYCDNVSKIMVYMNREKQFSAFSKFRHARKECYDFNIDFENFMKDNVLLLKEDYLVLNKEKNKLIKNKTRFAAVYPEIESLIMQGYSLPVIIEIFGFGLGGENIRAFNRLLQLLDTYFLHKIYVHHENFHYLTKLNSRFNTVGRIHDFVEFNKDYEKKEFFAWVNKIKCDDFMQYELEAIMVQDNSQSTNKDIIRFVKNNDLKTIFEHQGISLSAGIDFESLELKIRLTKLILLLEQSLKTIRQEKFAVLGSDQLADLEEKILADKYLYETIFTMEN